MTEAAASSASAAAAGPSGSTGSSSSTIAAAAAAAPPGAAAGPSLQVVDAVPHDAQAPHVQRGIPLPPTVTIAVSQIPGAVSSTTAALPRSTEVSVVSIRPQAGVVAVRSPLSATPSPQGHGEQPRYVPTPPPRARRQQQHEQQRHQHHGGAGGLQSVPSGDWGTDASDSDREHVD